MKQHAPATERNRLAIFEVLKRALPSVGTVLEIAAGTGEHAVFFSEQFPELTWLPTDGNPESIASIDAWRSAFIEKRGTVSNLLPARVLDVRSRPWAIPDITAVLCINMLHISPWESAEALFAESAKWLSEGGPLILYGPFLDRDTKTAPSNAAFDQSLRQRNPSWGIRWLHAVDELAESVGLRRCALHPMPANNLVLEFSTRPA